MKLKSSKMPLISELFLNSLNENQKNNKNNQ